MISDLDGLSRFYRNLELNIYEILEWKPNASKWKMYIIVHVEVCLFRLKYSNPSIYMAVGSKKKKKKTM